MTRAPRPFTVAHATRRRLVLAAVWEGVKLASLIYAVRLAWREVTS